MTFRRRWRGRAATLARWCALAALAAVPLAVAGGATASAAPTGFDVAFNSGSLWTYNPSPGGSNSGLGMMYGTSPAIATLANSTYEEAFQANTGALWVVNSAGGGSSTGLGMAPGTSPAITTTTPTTNNGNCADRRDTGRVSGQPSRHILQPSCTARTRATCRPRSATASTGCSPHLSRGRCTTSAGRRPPPR
jgi:hypothetical protein